MRKKTQKKSLGKFDLQLSEQRRTVDFDTFDIHIQQLLAQVNDGTIWVAPAYQRLFRWGPKRCSQLIESIILGIPIPSLFMATNKDNTWEVVDGVQRLSTIVKFAGSDELRKKLEISEPLILSDLQKLSDFNGCSYENLPPNIQLHFRTRPLKVVTLNDKSDKVVRYDLFERLNTGGVELSEQEIRSCIFLGKFSDKLQEWAQDRNFQSVVRLSGEKQRNGTAEECVLRFFAFLDGYKTFEHSVVDFLNDYMAAASKSFDYKNKEKLFLHTFAELAPIFPNGIMRPTRKGATPLNLYEGIAVGAALALQTNEHLVARNVNRWMASEKLRQFTTGATNSRPAVKGRIEYCRDRFMGR